MPIAAEEMAAVFTAPGVAVRAQERRAFMVTPPSATASTSTIEEDLIEEVARLYGFERIAGASAARRGRACCRRPRRGARLHALRERLAARDYQEVINFSFVEPRWEADFAGEADPIRLLNPIASQQSVMRTLAHRLAGRQRPVQPRSARCRASASSRSGACSCATRRRPTARSRSRGLRQPMRIAAAALRPGARRAMGDAAARAVDFFDVKGDLEALAAPLAPRFEPAAHPGLPSGAFGARAGRRHAAGWLGRAASALAAEVRAAAAAGRCSSSTPDAPAALPAARPRTPSRFPPVVRDIALVSTPDVPGQAVSGRPSGRKTADRASDAAVRPLPRFRASRRDEKALRSG